MATKTLNKDTLFKITNPVEFSQVVGKYHLRKVGQMTFGNLLKFGFQKERVLSLLKTGFLELIEEEAPEEAPEKIAMVAPIPTPPPVAPKRKRGRPRKDG